MIKKKGLMHNKLFLKIAGKWKLTGLWGWIYFKFIYKYKTPEWCICNSDDWGDDCWSFNALVNEVGRRKAMKQIYKKSCYNCEFKKKEGVLWI